MAGTKKRLNDVRLSKTLARILRHDPAQVGIELDRQGWVCVDVLVAALRRSGLDVTAVDVLRVVESNDKQRYTIKDGRIRANQGHSIVVDLELKPVPPPKRLYHGTVGANLDSIFADGLHRGSRHHVHLSPDISTAVRVGARRGAPVVLAVDADRMARDGHVFYRSENGVWLTDAVPARYLTLAS
jgi:putative RNA 2'-phosphotransferase